MQKFAKVGKNAFAKYRNKNLSSDKKQKKKQ